MLAVVLILILLFIIYISLTPLATATKLSTDPAKMSSTVAKVNGLIAGHKVFIASKSYCPYCNATKSLFSSLDAQDVEILDLDELDDGREIQDALYSITNQRTVPNIFIGGEHIGGNSDVQALMKKGELKSKLQKVGSL